MINGPRSGQGQWDEMQAYQLGEWTGRGSRQHCFGTDQLFLTCRLALETAATLPPSPAVLHASDKLFPPLLPPPPEPPSCRNTSTGQ